MTEPGVIYLIPPIITICLSLCLAILSICKSKENINILFSLVCFVWSLTSVAYVVQQFTTSSAQIVLIEKAVNFFYCYAPVLHVFFFHKLINLKNHKIIYLILPVSILFSIFVFTDYFIKGASQYHWGYIAKTGPLFCLFILFAVIVAGYIIVLIGRHLIKEPNSITKLKIKYTFFSCLTAAILTLFNTLPLTGYDLYPMGNFTFIPLSLLAYGVLKYRVLKLKTILYIMLQYFVEVILILLPNGLIIRFFHPFFVQRHFFWLVFILLIWVYVNVYYLSKLRFFLNRIFDNARYDLKKAESRFIEHILLLKDIDRLIDEFITIVKHTLKFNSVDFFIPTSQSVFKNTHGKILELDLELAAWFIRTNHMTENNMVSTNPYYQPIKRKLLPLFEEQNCSYIIPMVQYDELVGIVFLKGKTSIITSAEVQFINNIKKFVVIALFNSILYQNTKGLKEDLEEKTEKLSKEIIERQNAEKVLIDSEKRYRLLAENILDTIWVIELPALEISYVSPSVKKLLNYRPEGLKGTTIEKLLSPESMKKAKSQLEESLKMYELGKAKPLMLEMELIKKDHSTVWVEFSTYFILDKNNMPISIICAARDISERLTSAKEKNALESKLRQAQKMESIGVLAGGIAHDFNNILMAILGYTQLALFYTPTQNHKLKTKIRQIETACQRAKEMVSKILAFSRQSKQEKIPLNLAMVISEAVSLLKASLPSTIELTMEFQNNLKPALADPVQMHQIIINLCTNSYHAMEKNGGKCHIVVSNTSIEENQAKSLEISSGDYLKIKIHDTGQGMDPYTLERIFDPYFTTKETGKGTGMGLSVVHGIVMSHNGAISVESENGRGTKFTILIPAGEKKIENPRNEKTILASGKEKILFIDDEQVLVDFANEALKRFGYDVTATTSADKALALFSNKPEAFDIVVTDFTMPEMTGEILAEEIHRIRADIPIILCTGYSNPISNQAKINSGISDILIKPLSLAELTTAIRKAL